jgi:outer membrane protein TolC
MNRRSLLLTVVFCTAAAPQNANDNAGGQRVVSSLLSNVQNDKTLAPGTEPDIAKRYIFLDLLAPYKSPSAPVFRVADAARAQTLVHNGAIYLPLYDALALAIENNLDVEVARYNLSITGTEPLRAAGGGNLRQVDLTVAESPTGVGGPGSPLLNSAAASVTPTTPTVNDLTSLNVLTETETNLSVESSAAYSAGPPVPAFDPSLIGQNTYFQRSNSASLTTATLGTTTVGAAAMPGTLDFTTANYAYIQGFSTGTQLEVDLTNSAQAVFGNRSNLDPFSQPNTSVTLTQPLLRGFGRAVNLRYLKIAQLDERISRLAFYQQLISTVYGISRLYYDLVSLNENVTVARQSLAAAQKLLEDDKAQLEQGTLAPLDVTQAQALVTSSQLNLIQAEGLVKQEEVILKSQLSGRGTADPLLANLPIIPTDRIAVPENDGTQPLDELVNEALDRRPDLAQALLQVESGQVAAHASQNEVRPELDVIGNFQTRGSSEAPFNVLGTPGTGLVNTPADLGVAGLRLSRIYEAGIQVNLPVRNRAAQADAARDVLELRQAQVRTERLKTQVREEVENSLIALRTARSALSAATQSRVYQEQLVQAERDRLSVGASTNFLVIQQEAYLAQARSTEVAARSVWIKARVSLDRSVGDLLEKNGIRYDESVRGHLPYR